MRSIAWTVLIALALSPTALAADKDELEVFHDKGYLVAQTDDGKTKYWIDGRIMLDWGTISGENVLADGWETRRARLAVKSIFNNKWAGELDVDIADNEVDIKDFWIAYVGFEDAILKVGNHKVPTSMEDMTSSRWVTFMERGLLNSFTIGRRIGVSVNHWGEKYLVMAGFFGEEPGKGEDSGEPETYGYAGRVGYAPIRTDDSVVHLGVSYNNFNPEAGEDNEVRFRGRELHLMDRLLNTGKVDMVDKYENVGYELAFQKGPWSIQSEYMTAELNRFSGSPDASFDGYYAYVSWFAFGGQRTYSMDSAEFGAVHPESERGALEFAVRFSNLDLNDVVAGVEGGKADNMTLGVNWYANDHVRLMFNYIRQDNDEFADGDGDFLGNDNLDIFAARFQLLF